MLLGSIRGTGDRTPGCRNFRPDRTIRMDASGNHPTHPGRWNAFGAFASRFYLCPLQNPGNRCFLLHSLDLPDEMIGLPRWPWNPETVGHRARKGNRALQANSMALRDIHRLSPLPCAQNRSNRLPVVHQGRPRPWSWPWLPGNPDKHRLGTTYRRAVKDYSQVAGNPKPARVRVPMTVIKNQVRRVPQLRKRPQHHRKPPGTGDSLLLRRHRTRG